MHYHLNLLIAFIAGLASFLSPCVLPLVPSYLAQMVGPGVMEALMGSGTTAAGSKSDIALTSGNHSAVALPALQRRLPLWHALAFVGGFSIAFIVLGATASVLGGFFRGNQELISRNGGLLLILLGLHYAGFIQIPLLNREGRLHWRPAQRSYASSAIIGFIFAFGWTPCVGPILTLILGLAAQSATLAAGIVLLAAYSLGLGLPFIILGAAFTQAQPLLRQLGPHLGTIERVTGIIITCMGLFIMNGWLIYLNRYFNFSIGGL